jgi:hypothetical protein
MHANCSRQVPSLSEKELMVAPLVGNSLPRTRGLPPFRPAELCLAKESPLIFVPGTSLLDRS